MYDVIIIGMGCAGMSAGIYAKNSGLKALILESKYPGGILNKVNIVDNYLGFNNITGPELVDKMYNHIKDNEVEYKFEKVLNIKMNEEYKEITTTKNIYKSKALIFAGGRKARNTNLESEKKFKGKGISYCAICDGRLFKDKDIVVLGGGSSAFEEAMYLSKIVKSIKILIKNEISALDELVSTAENINNIEIIKGVYVTEFKGEDTLKSVKLNTNEEIKCEGAFIYYGYDADSEYLRELGILDEKGYIIVDKSMRTKVPYIYACGDIIKKELYQVATAVAEGSIAAVSARKDIK